MATYSGWRPTRAGIVFIIGVVLLIALVVGAIWFVRERGEQARRDEATQIAQQEQQAQEEQQNSEDAPASEETPAPEDGTVTEETPAETEPEVATTAPAPNELPQTGGELQALIGVIFLSLATALYVGSRRAVQQG